MQEIELMRYSEAVGNATESAAQAELSPALMVACLTRFIDVVVRCADDDSYRPRWSQDTRPANDTGLLERIENSERRASVA